jgi:oligopeptide/dipeptide ABC transporter ATP-binding protein
VQGKIFFEGPNRLELSEKQMRLIRGSKISMVFQEPATSLNPVYTVGDQIAEAIQLHQNKAAVQAWEDAVALLRKVGIADPERRVLEYPHRLSGGMQQRVMIAMAISCKPSLLIADEPTTALDTTVQAQILDLLDDLQKQNGMSILLITHNLGIVAQRADIIAVMYASRIVEIADSRQLLAQPHHPYTQGLLQSLPPVGSPPTGSAVKRLQTIPGMVPEPLHLPSGCKFHPRCRAGCADMRCRKIEPALRETQPGRWTACWLAPGYE